MDERLLESASDGESGSDDRFKKDMYRSSKGEEEGEGSVRGSEWRMGRGHRAGESEEFEG